MKPGLVIVSTLTCLMFSCSKSQQRPANVPEDAVKVVGPKGTGPWQSCELTSDSQVHCRLFNKVGEMLYDDAFVVYVGNAPRSSRELKISTDGGDQWVRLENGTILIPEKERFEMTRFLDWLFGKRLNR